MKPKATQWLKANSCPCSLPYDATHEMRQACVDHESLGLLTLLGLMNKSRSKHG